MNEGPTQTQKPWWRRGGGGSIGVDGFQQMSAAAMSVIPASWSNDDSLRCLAFRLDFNEYYDRVGFGGNDAASDEEEEEEEVDDV